MEQTNTPQLGRPVNPNSRRQQELAAKMERRALGLVKRGRPVVEGSKRQQELDAKMERMIINGGVVRRGRPVNGESKRQQLLNARAELAALGIVRAPGRPKVVIAE